MQTYLVSLGIILLGLWVLETLLVYEAVDLFLTFGLGPSWDGWSLGFLSRIALNLIVGMAIIAVPSGIFAAFLYLVASHYTRPVSQRAVLACCIIFTTASAGLVLAHLLVDGWPWKVNMLILFSAPLMLGYYLEDMTWQEAIANPLGLQLLLTPVLLSGCMVVGHLSQRRRADANDFGD